MNQLEKEIEKHLLEGLETRPHEITILRSAFPDVRTMADLLGGRQWERFHDSSYWNQYKHFMEDVSGGMCPDLVIYEKTATGGTENRIYIEVKATKQLGYGLEDSQIIRYFLHLLVTTKRVPRKDGASIRRAVLVCAPSQWFKQPKNSKSWNYFLEHFADLAKAFDITLGELHCDEF